jgi:cation diffusion facilitator family transporter
MAGHEHGTRAIIAAFLANLGIAISKFVAFAFTGSASMLAEGIHSVADTGNQGLLLLGGRRARKAPTEAHPFGFGAERYFWAFLVAMVLFMVGAAFAVFEGIEKIREPHKLESPAWAIIVLALAICLESYSFRTAFQEANKLRGDQSLLSFIRTSKAPEVPVVLLEDMAALSGLVIALAAVGTSIATDDAVWDGYGTLSIGILLGIVAMVLAIEMKSLLIGEAASPADLEAIRTAIEAHPQISRVISLRTMHLGPDELLVTAKIEVGENLAGAELGHAIDEVEDQVRAAVPTAKVIYLEPDVFRESRR